MPWVLLAVLIVYGALSIVFAFVQPPEGIRSWFKVPAIFVFLPDRWVMPAGRFFVGVCAIVGAGYYAMNLLRVG